MSPLRWNACTSWIRGKSRDNCAAGLRGIWGRTRQAKGKVELRIRDGRAGCSPYRRHWEALEEVQAHTDALRLETMRRRMCPTTRTDVICAWEHERAHLGPLPKPMREPFDIAVTRRVGADWTVAFEGRIYSVPFSLVGRQVEVRGWARHVQILAEAEIVAAHPRATAHRIVIDPGHFQGESTETVIAPAPLGRMGTRIAEIAALAPESRPLDHDLGKSRRSSRP